MKNFLLSAALILCAAPAVAQVQCAPYNEVSAGLIRNFGESLRSSGLSQNGVMMHLYANNSTGTWTILVVNPQGIACLSASGEGFQPVGENS